MSNLDLPSSAVWIDTVYGRRNDVGEISASCQKNKTLKNKIVTEVTNNN